MLTSRLISRLCSSLLACLFVATAIAAAPRVEPQLTPHDFILGNHPAGVTAVAFSPDGKSFASASSDGTIILWALATKSSTLTVKAQAPVSAITFVPDGTAVLAALHEPNPRNFHLLRLDFTTGEMTGCACDYFLKSLAFTPDGQTLIGCDPNGILISWAYTKSGLDSPRWCKSANSLAAFPEPDNKHFLTVDGMANWCRWTLTPVTRTIRPDDSKLRPLGLMGPFAFNDNHTMVACSGGGARGVTLRRYPSGLSIPQAPGYGLPIRVAASALAFSHDNHLLVAGGSDGHLYCWNLNL
jgi:WD40 repeat protein